MQTQYLPQVLGCLLQPLAEEMEMLSLPELTHALRTQFLKVLQQGPNAAFLPGHGAHKWELGMLGGANMAFRLTGSLGLRWDRSKDWRYIGTIQGRLLRPCYAFVKACCVEVTPLVSPSAPAVFLQKLTAKLMVTHSSPSWPFYVYVCIWGSLPFFFFFYVQVR